MVSYACQRGFEFRLDGMRISLALPTVVSATVIFDTKRNSLR